MRRRETQILLDRVYVLPSGNRVRVDHSAGDGALACHYAADAFGAREHLFTRQPVGEVWLTERFIAKHARGPLR